MDRTKDRSSQVDMDHLSVGRFGRCCTWDIWISTIIDDILLPRLLCLAGYVAVTTYMFYCAGMVPSQQFGEGDMEEGCNGASLDTWHCLLSCPDGRHRTWTGGVNVDIRP